MKKVVLFFAVCASMALASCTNNQPAAVEAQNEVDSIVATVDSNVAVVDSVVATAVDSAISVAETAAEVVETIENAVEAAK